MVKRPTLEVRREINPGALMRRIIAIVNSTVVRLNTSSLLRD